MIRLRNVSKSYDGGLTFAVREVDLEVRPAELLVIVGESGSGKTTTLKMINRLVEPTSGMIVVDGKSVSESDPVDLRRRIGYVLQEVGLFPHMTVEENVAVVPELLGWDREEIHRRVEDLFALVGLDAGSFRLRYPAELSGGQRQRVGFARALAAGPRIMLMDEPFGALDPITRGGLQFEFRRMQQQLRLTVVMVTHDMMEALLVADRICVMEKGQIVEVATPSELLTQAVHPYAAALVRSPKEQADRLEALSKASGA